MDDLDRTEQRRDERRPGSGLRLSQFSIDHPVTILMVFASLMVLGAVSITRIPVVLTPDISFPFVSVNVPYPNSTPGQVLEAIAKPVEEALSTLPERAAAAIERRATTAPGSASVSTGVRTST